MTIVGDDLGSNDVSTFYGNAELYSRSIVVKRKILMIIFDRYLDYIDDI